MKKFTSGGRNERTYECIINTFIGSLLTDKHSIYEISFGDAEPVEELEGFRG